MNHCTAEQLIAFERRVADIFETGELPFLIHLSGGNEEQLIDIFSKVKPGDWIFSGHRNHYHWLLAGGDPGVLEKKIRNGNSMFVYGKAGEFGLQCNFITSSILAGTCCIAAGTAWALMEKQSKSHVWCFLGDGAEDNGHFYEAVSFVEGHNLPCRFVIEDNDRSVDTSKDQRRGGKAVKVPLCRNASCVRSYDYQPAYPHGGTGTKTWVKFREEIVERFAR